MGQRWDDDLEDIEDDLAVESRNALLSTEDPKMLQEHLDTSLEEAYQVLNEKISALLTTYEDSEQIGQMSVYLLRVIRDLRTELPTNISLQSFGLPLVEPLHQRLASEVSAKPVQIFSKSCTRKKVPAEHYGRETPSCLYSLRRGHSSCYIAWLWQWQRPEVIYGVLPLWLASSEIF